MCIEKRICEIQATGETTATTMVSHPAVKDTADQLEIPRPMPALRHSRATPTV